MTGSTNAQQAQNIVNKINAALAVQGGPGNWSVSLPHIVIASLGLPSNATGAQLAIGAGPISLGETAVIQAAVAKSNAAAIATPSAASGQPTTSNTPLNTITTIVQGVTKAVGNIPNDVKALEQGATAKLNWWGWELDLDADATKALESLLTGDVASLMTIMGAIGTATGSAPIAAAAAIITAVAAGLSAWVSQEDSQNTPPKGVSICGCLWVAIVVNPA